MPKITCFVARSFHPDDESKIAPIIKHLDTFHDLGFTWVTAERAEMESVSVKVRKVIDGANVFVGILTRRHPVFDLSEKWRSAFHILTSRLTPASWTPPAWIIQEAGYAQKAGLKLFFFRELGVELPGLQADLEYIDFSEGNYVTAFQRANEMIHRVIGERSGILVETSVSIVAPSVETKEVSAEQTEVKEKTTSPGLAFAIRDLFDAIFDKKDFDEAARVYIAEAERIAKETPQHAIPWACLYYRSRFEGGDESALSDLRALAEREPSSPLPRTRIAECLTDYNEFVPAAEEYLGAADLSSGRKAAEFKISAAHAFRKGKELSRAETIVLEILTHESGELKETRGEALRELYEVFKASHKTYHALAIGELVLSENPALNDFRFQLAYDYSEWNFDDMAIHHYSLICQRHPDNSGAILNLGVSYAKRELEIHAGEAYTKAYELGESIAAKNLAYRYLKGGMATEASELVKKGMEMPDADPTLAEVLSAIEEQRKSESEKKKSFEESAEEHRAFALAFSAGLISALPCDVEGTWDFPFARMLLESSDFGIVGTGESSEEGQLSKLAGLLYAQPVSPSKEIRKFSLYGSSAGRTARFHLDVQSATPLTVKSILGSIGSTDQGKEGLIVFSESCDSAEVAELKDGIPHKFYTVNRDGSKITGFS